MPPISREDKVSLVRAVNRSKGDREVARRVEWAGTSAERRRGLLGKDRLGPDEGIYLVPCRWVHTFRMRFAIDVAFLAPGGRLVAASKSLKPNRLSRIALRAEGALELAAGTLDNTGTEVGDLLVFLDAP